ncbi:MAG: hypothetical protein ACI8UO_002932 [Verrucomicrobiales bacterium]|jgi:hypothetical protein
MLKIDGHRFRNCDGQSRRSFVQAGAIGLGALGGFSLPELLRAEGGGSSQKSIIHIHLDGGPPQMDMIDPKPDSPVEVRGEFDSIPTKLPGVHVTELMPKTAQIADKLIFLRSLVGSAGRHDAFQCQSGFNVKDLAGLGGHPAMGCVVNQLLGSPSDAAPAFVDIMQGRGQLRRSARPGFLGPVYKPFQPDISHLFHRELEAGMKGELARLKREAPPTNLSLSDGVTLGRLEDRVGLLNGLDSIRAEVDASGSMGAKDEFTQQAMQILTSGRMASALDLESEDPKVLAKFTPSWHRNPNQFYTGEGPEAARKLLLARRLVEAGARVVSVSISDWDTHSLNFSRMRDLVPIFDFAFHALVTDLEERGMLDDVTVLAWGEFGRTPRVNAKAGRDHWGRVAMGMMAGGGMNAGQVIGATDRMAAEPTERPVHYQDVIATLYHNLGIDARTTTVMDPTGRPQYLVDVGQPIRELI